MHTLVISEIHQCYLKVQCVESVGQTYISRLQLVDDGGFSTVVQTETKNIHLLLQPQPCCQFVKQPHLLASNHQLPVWPTRNRPYIILKEMVTPAYTHIAVQLFHRSTLAPLLKQLLQSDSFAFLHCYLFCAADLLFVNYIWYLPVCLCAFLCLSSRSSFQLTFWRLCGSRSDAGHI